MDIPKITTSEIDYYGSNPDNIDNQCQYNLTFHSIYGCPHSCPLYNKRVCMGYGFCGYDSTTNHEPHCFCYSTYGGIACELVNDEHHEMFVPSNLSEFVIDYDLDDIAVHQFNWTKYNDDGNEFRMNVTYDLGAFKHVFHVKDLDGTQYDYYLGGVPDEYSTVCGNKTDEGLLFEIISGSEPECIIVGGYEFEWDLYDTSNPAKGVSLAFKNGEYCEKNDDYRSIKVNFICPDDDNVYYTPNKTMTVFVEEDDWDSCSYHMDIVSAWSCPRECITNVGEDADDGVTVCSTHGMCMADVFSGYVHCKCDNEVHPPHRKGVVDDFIYVYDDYCRESKVVIEDDDAGETDEAENTSNTGYIAAIVILSVVFVLFCCIGGYMFYRQRKQIIELNVSNSENYEQPMLEEHLEEDVPKVTEFEEESDDER